VRLGGGPRRPHSIPRRQLAIVLALATLFGLYIACRPSLSPPGVHERGLFAHGVAKSEILVDTTTSDLVDRDQDVLGPPSLALTYALYLQTDPARGMVAARLGLPPGAVAASGPFTYVLKRPNLTVARQIPVAKTPVPKDSKYRLLLDVAEARPMLTIYAEAPTQREARVMVGAAEDALRRYVDFQQKSFPINEESRSVLRKLGPIDGATVNRHAGIQFAIAMFLLTCVTGFVIIYRRARRRSAAVGVGPREDPEDPPNPATDNWPHTKRLMPWALAGFLCMLYLIPFAAVTLPLPLPGDGVLDRPVLMAIAGLWIIALVSMRGSARPHIRFTRVHLAVLIFFTICCLSLAVNADELAARGEFGLGLKKLILIGSYVLFFLIVASGIRPLEVQRFVKLLLVLASLAALGTIIEFRFDFNVFYWVATKMFPGMVAMPADMFGVDEIGRVNIYGPTSLPLELAGLLAMAVPFAIVQLLDAEDRRHRLIYGAILAILLAGAFSTGKKTSILVPALGVLLILAYRPRALRRLIPVGLCLTVLINVLAPGMLWSLYFQLVNFGNVQSTQDRASDYDAVGFDFSSHLLIGRGFKTFDPHVYRVLDNEFLGLLIGVGLLGMLVYSSILVFAATAAHRTIRRGDPMRAPHALAASAAIATYGLANAFFDVLSFPHVPYLMFFIAGMILALREPQPAADLPPPLLVRTRAPATGPPLRPVPEPVEA